MKTIHLSYPHGMNNREIPQASAAIGFFDGVHLGHQEVINHAISDAKQHGRNSAVITFYPHPSVVLRKGSGQSHYITPLPDKEKFLEKMGVDILYVIEFNKDLSRLTPEEFVQHFLVELNIKHIVAGFDFTFGYKGKGNMKEFDQYSDGKLSFSVIDKIDQEGEKVSSTRIRRLMNDGEMEKANQLLGRPLTLTGLVVKGDKRGRTIGYPTANLDVSEEYQFPKTGVYAVKLQVGEQKWNGMANLGYKPTFQEKQDRPEVEVHLFDFEGNLYGETVTMEWYTYIREEKKFQGVNELIKNLKNDEEKIRSQF